MLPFLSSTNGGLGWSCLTQEDDKKSKIREAIKIKTLPNSWWSFKFEEVQEIMGASYGRLLVLIKDIKHISLKLETFYYKDKPRIEFFGYFEILYSLYNSKFNEICVISKPCVILKWPTLEETM